MVDGGCHVIGLTDAYDRYLMWRLKRKEAREIRHFMKLWKRSPKVFEVTDDLAQQLTREGEKILERGRQ